MEKFKRIKISSIGLGGIGLIMLFFNITNIKYTGLFGNDITKSYKTLIDNGILPQSSAEFALKWQKSGNLAVFGIALIVIAVIILFVNNSKQNKEKQAEQQK